MVVNKQSEGVREISPLPGDDDFDDIIELEWQDFPEGNKRPKR